MTNISMITKNDYYYYYYYLLTAIGLSPGGSERNYIKKQKITPKNKNKINVGIK
jgi:hypothetical protein